MRAAFGMVLSLFLLLTLQGQTPPALKTTQAPGPGSFVEVENGKLYYEECGSGPQTVVLLHDGGAHSAIWDDVWPAFCKQFHTIRYDRRGYGKSPEATTWYYEIEDLATLLRHLKVARTVVVGSSHGGSMSIDFTLQYPQMV
jgi:3-oxoadipate enol-lactonase